MLQEAKDKRSQALVPWRPLCFFPPPKPPPGRGRQGCLESGAPPFVLNQRTASLTSTKAVENPCWCCAWAGGAGECFAFVGDFHLKIASDPSRHHPQTGKSQQRTTKRDKKQKIQMQTAIFSFSLACEKYFLVFRFLLCAWMD